LLGIPETLNERGEIVEAINWGFYGLICGMSFVVLLADYINGKLDNKLALVAMPVMFLGVLMSTSRSALLGVAGISFFIIAREFNHQARWKRAASLLMIIFSALVISLIVFMSIQSLFNLNTDFMDEIALRLIDEPIAVLNKHLGLNYNVHALGAMEWRTEASSDALGAFLNLKTGEEFFGIGFWGYVTRNLGHNNLPPHNGLLMLLIEFGIVGLVYWSLMIYSYLAKSFRVSDMTSPMSVSIFFIILFSLANNAELTGSIMFLFVSTLIAENIFFERSQAKVISMAQTRSKINFTIVN
jgi:O-antigen ligase